MTRQRSDRNLKEIRPGYWKVVVITGANLPLDGGRELIVHTSRELIEVAAALVKVRREVVRDACVTQHHVSGRGEQPPLRPLSASASISARHWRAPL